MPNYTDNLGLKKPTGEEYFSLSDDYNSTRDLIDKFVGTSGISTLTAGNQEATVTHNFMSGGVATEPDIIEITPYGDLGYWHITAKDATTFTVKFSVAPSTNTNFAWRVHAKTEV